MSTTQAVLVETISKPQLRGLPSRKAAAAERLNKIRDLASALMEEAKSLDHENGLAETSATVENLNLKSKLDFFEEVRRVEVRVITPARGGTRGNKTAARAPWGL